MPPQFESTVLNDFTDKFKKVRKDGHYTLEVLEAAVFN
jgi:hypothetical protein